MYFRKPQVLDGYEWLRDRVKEIRLNAIDNGRKIKHIRIEKGTYKKLRENYKKYSPFRFDDNDDFMIYGIFIKPHEFDNSMMVEPVWNWKTLQGIY